MNQEIVINIDSLSFSCQLSYFDDTIDMNIFNRRCNDTTSYSPGPIDFIANGDACIVQDPDIVGRLAKLGKAENNLWQLVSTSHDTILVSISDSIMQVLESNKNAIRKHALFFTESIRYDNICILNPKWKNGKREGCWTFIDFRNMIDCSIIYHKGTVIDTCFIQKM